MDRKINEKSAKAEQLNWFYWFLVILTLIVAASIAFSLYSKPDEGFSGVWLNEMPKEAAAGEKFNFSFTINNFFDSAKNYRFTVSVNGASASDQNVLLSAKEQKSFSIPVDLGASQQNPQKIELLVWRDGRQEPFDLWHWVEVK